MAILKILTLLLPIASQIMSLQLQRKVVGCNLLALVSCFQIRVQFEKISITSPLWIGIGNCKMAVSGGRGRGGVVSNRKHGMNFLSLENKGCLSAKLTNPPSHECIEVCINRL